MFSGQGLQQIVILKNDTFVLGGRGCLNGPPGAHEVI